MAETKKPVNEWERTEKVWTERARPGEEKQLYISINGRTCMVPLDGKEHELKAPFAERYRLWVAANVRAEDYVDSLSNNAPNSQPNNAG